MDILTRGIIPEHLELLALLTTFVFAFYLGYSLASKIKMRRVLTAWVCFMFLLLFAWKILVGQETSFMFQFLAGVSFFFVTGISTEKLWEYMAIYSQFKSGWKK